jgi:beta-lactamase class A
MALVVLAGTGFRANVLAALRRPTPSRIESRTATTAVATDAAIATPVPSATPKVTVGTAAPRSFDALAAQMAALQSTNGARIGLSVIELGGANPQAWSFAGDDSFVAASTYKLPLLMAEAELIASGQALPGDQVCYTTDDWEDGWFQDYAPGICYSRAELAGRIGLDSDNTAAHMLVRFLGGGAALNAYAAGRGAKESGFYDPNTTTANDLARLMAAEATGEAGGASAQRWIYPLLTHTAFEGGIPTGIPAGLEVVHKTGELGSVTNDVGLIVGGANGPYVLAVCVDGPGGDAGLSLIAQASSLVWQAEAGR